MLAAVRLLTTRIDGTQTNHRNQVKTQGHVR